jgi:hypothetical protein
MNLIFSRSGESNPFGKNTEEVRSLLDERTKDALTALAFASSMSLSEYIRFLLLSHVHGAAQMLRIAARPISGSAGNESE